MPDNEFKRMFEEELRATEEQFSDLVNGLKIQATDTQQVILRNTIRMASLDSIRGFMHEFQIEISNTPTKLDDPAFQKECRERLEQIRINAATILARQVNGLANEEKKSDTDKELATQLTDSHLLKHLTSSKFAATKYYKIAHFESQAKIDARRIELTLLELKAHCDKYPNNDEAKKLYLQCKKAAESFNSLLVNWKVSERRDFTKRPIEMFVTSLKSIGDSLDVTITQAIEAAKPPAGFASIVNKKHEADYVPLLHDLREQRSVAQIAAASRLLQPIDMQPFTATQTPKADKR